MRVHEDTGETRVTRFLGSFDAGRIVNPKLATSQFRGIGMALTEETLFDERRGRIVNPSLAEYHVPVHLDVPPIEILWTDIPDPHAPLGVHGIGEIGITGVAAAIANAVFNATGKRVRDLPNHARQTALAQTTNARLQPGGPEATTRSLASLENDCEIHASPGHRCHPNPRPSASAAAGSGPVAFAPLIAMEYRSHSGQTACPSVSAQGWLMELVRTLGTGFKSFVA